MKAMLISCLIIPFISGCSLINPGPGDGQKPDWDKLAPVIQSRVRIAASFAFTMEQVKPHKQQVCDVAHNLSEFLNTYDDRDANFERLRSAAMEFVESIQDPGTRQAVMILVDLIFTEAFNYAWLNYEELINRDEAQTTILIARAISNGLQEACSIAISSINRRNDSIGYRTFTISEE